MVIVWSEENRCYLVHLPDFPEQLYPTSGDSYVEAAKNGEVVLQQLLKGEAPTGISKSTKSPPEKSEPFLGSLAIKEPIKEATRSSDQPSSALALQPKKQLYRWIPTAIASLVTSATAVAALVAIAFISEGVISQTKQTAAAPSTEQPPLELASSTAESSSEDKTETAANSEDRAEIAASADLSTTDSTEESQFVLTQSITEPSTVWAIATYSDTSRNVNLVASGNETGQIVIRDQISGQPIRTIEAHDDKVRSIAIAPKARRILSSSGDGIKAWNLDTGELIYALSTAAPVWSVAIAPDESRFVSGAHDGNIAAWDLETGKPLYNLNNGATVWSIAISPDGNAFVSGDSNRAVRQWSLKTGQSLKTFTGHEGDVRAVVFSPDGKTIASGSWDKTIRLWSVETGDVLETLEGHRDRVISLAISNDGETLASGSVDATVKHWSLTKDRPINTLGDPFDWVLSVAFTKDGTLIASGKDREIRLWQTEKSASK